jgi:DivIVA domain-containing protein
MPAVEIDRQSIERRDFPITRRGYDPAAVDAHLRALAAEVEELAREGAGGQAPSLAATAGTQVQSILQAAETAAANIEREALERARTAREEADRDASSTREGAIAHAREHVAAVAAATSVLLERVSSMDAELGAIVESLRAGATRLAGDLAAIDSNMGELYDAASGASARSVPHGRSASAAETSAPPSPPPTAGPPAPGPPRERAASAPSRRGQNAAASSRSGPPSAAGARTPASAEPEPPPEPAEAREGDLDGARLIALNMALNGQSRADADRYLAENFHLDDRQKLIDEVYAAIEG